MLGLSHVAGVILCFTHCVENASIIKHRAVIDLSMTSLRWSIRTGSQCSREGFNPMARPKDADGLDLGARGCPPAGKTGPSLGKVRSLSKETMVWQAIAVPQAAHNTRSCVMFPITEG